jgi:hypothetical protein
MKRSLAFRLCYLGLAAQLVCEPGTLFADKTVQPPAAQQERLNTDYDLQIVDGQLIRPSGKGEAMLPNVIDALRDQYTQANIVLSPSLAKVKVGDLKLRAGHLDEELEAVRVASGEKFQVHASGRPNPTVDPTTGLPPTQDLSINSGLFVLREAPPTAQSQKIVEAFNIGPYLEWLGHRPTADQRGNPENEGLSEIYRVIGETIHDFQGDSNDANVPKCQYHHGATLLVVIGTVESVEIARKIVNALPGMSAAESGRGQPSSTRTAQERAAEDAFRARYGMLPRTPATSAPESGAAK